MPHYYHGWPPGNPNHPDYAPAKTTMSWRNALGKWGGLLLAVIANTSSAYGIGTILGSSHSADYAWVALGMTMGVYTLGYAIGVAIESERITWR